MKWEDKVKTYGEPKKGSIYVCKIENFNTGRVIKEDLKAVESDDHLWETLDGCELNEWAWDVISWHQKK